MGQIKGKNVFRFDSDEKLYAIFVDELKKAYSKNYSVIEIQRLLNHRTCKKLYRIMREAGIFASMQSGRKKTYKELNKLFLDALEKCELSYDQWCCSHGFEPRVTAEMINKEKIPGNRISENVHRAFQKDFGKLYSTIFVGAVQASSSDNSDWEAVNFSSVSIIGDPEKKIFVAYSHDMPDHRVEGKTLDEAYFKLKARYVLIISIKKLRALMQND